MKSLTAFFTAALLALPALVHAHPGHTALDFTAGAPHAGHAGEWGALAAGIVAATLVAAGWHLAKRRR